MTSTDTDIDPRRIPAHIAIIMDGNGRWAKARGLQRSAGHIAGVDTVRSTISTASELGIRYLTLYAFSTENWQRPAEEVDALLHLIVIALERETPEMVRNNVRLAVIGDISRFPKESKESLQRSLEATAGCTGLQVNLALSYSARWEITRAAKVLAAMAAEGKISPDDIDDALFADNLSTASMPDPDLLIRTGGDSRISNFLLWQIAYCELYFTPRYWPDFSPEDLREAIIAFQSRERRFGKTSEQITLQSE